MHSLFSIRQKLAMALVVLLLATAVDGMAAERWWKGNLHTHTFWSDGDDFPESVTDWYKRNGYHFLGLSDHNVMLEGEKWIHSISNRGGAEAFEKYVKAFGRDWAVTREGETGRMVRLKTLEEFRGRFEEPGRFLMIPSEEISDRFEKAPIHLNASNLRELIPPQGGKSVQDVIQNNINAVLEQRRRTGQPLISHVNHPNFGWAITAEDMAPVEGERFFEVYNGHPGVRNYGDPTYAGTERIWDIILSLRLAELGLPAVWGTAVDDAHAYHSFSVKRPNPGRGWVMVRAQELTPEALIHAMEQGDFYASTGVRLKEITRTKNKLSFVIDGEPGVTYKTTFVGTRKGTDLRGIPVVVDGKTVRATRTYNSGVGAVLAQTDSLSPSYKFKGDEIYVRARVVSSVAKENPYAEGDMEMAWIQPVVTGVK
jgi:hypothetical protein